MPKRSKSVSSGKRKGRRGPPTAFLHLPHRDVAGSRDRGPDTVNWEALNADALARALRNLMGAQELLLNALGWCDASARTSEEDTALRAINLATSHAKHALQEAGRSSERDLRSERISRKGLLFMLSRLPEWRKLAHEMEGCGDCEFDHDEPWESPAYCSEHRRRIALTAWRLREALLGGMRNLDRTPERDREMLGLPLDQLTSSQSVEHHPDRVTDERNAEIDAVNEDTENLDVAKVLLAGAKLILEERVEDGAVSDVLGKIVSAVQNLQHEAVTLRRLVLRIPTSPPLSPPRIGGR